MFENDDEEEEGGGGIIVTIMFFVKGKYMPGAIILSQIYIIGLLISYFLKKRTLRGREFNALFPDHLCGKP